MVKTLRASANGLHVIVMHTVQPDSLLLNGQRRSRSPVVQHGFYAVAFGTPSLFGDAGWPWYNFRSSGIVRFV